MRFRCNFSRKACMRFSLWLVILLLACSIKWVFKQFHRVNMDEIALVLQLGPGGVDGGLMWSFIKKVILRSVFWSVVLAWVCEKWDKKYKFLPWLVTVGVLGVLGLRIFTANIQLGSFFASEKSQFYEQEYVNPEDAHITFKKKRDVLLIVLESVEKKFADEELFGPGGLTPNITRLENNHISFQKYEQLSGLSHTIAAITGMTTGLPLFFSSYRNVEKMLGASGIGSVFVKHGYETWSFFPASGQFSLKENFLKRMGFQHVYDGERLRSMLDYELDVDPFDGIDDGTLFTMTRPMIQEIIDGDKPYFILMETINTHNKGYFTQFCRDLGFEQENMADIAKCQDKILADFIDWFRKQDPDAVVILIDDHVQRSGEIWDALKDVESRPLSNVFINTNAFYGVDINRPVAAVDFFPTIIESAGGQIRGCRLGLGTALTARCADVPTLRERYGDAELQRIMEQRNDLYYQLATGIKQNETVD